MVNIRTAATILPVLALLASCASMNRDQCTAANWYAIGLEDGARGAGLERLGEHRRACAEYHIAPDAERYMQGRAEGLKSFCTYERGFSEGRSGHNYTGACPPNLAGNFSVGYQRGRDLYEYNSRLAQIQEEIRRTKAALTAGIPDPRARAREAQRLEDLSREAEQLEEQIARLPAR